uniref:Uncharacterized protein MANES_16G083000 n=1 Tax=Rhizophora mucronata TaxID=61149 RepID=A0A2P2MVP2_RHIMU
MVYLNLNGVGFLKTIQPKTLSRFIQKLSPYFPLWKQAISC